MEWTHGALLDNHPISVGDHVFKVLRVSSLVEAEVGDLVGMDRDLIKMTELMSGWKMLEGCQGGKSLVDAQFPIGKLQKVPISANGALQKPGSPD